MTLIRNVVAATAIAIAVLCAYVADASAYSCVASWYPPTGNRTANGERFDSNGLTCAHLSYPFGTRLRIGFGGRHATCRVNDRGPYVRGRCVDLSRRMRDELHMPGLARVEVEVLRF